MPVTKGMCYVCHQRFVLCLSPKVCVMPLTKGTVQCSRLHCSLFGKSNHPWLWGRTKTIRGRGEHQHFISKGIDKGWRLRDDFRSGEGWKLVMALQWEFSTPGGTDRRGEGRRPGGGRQEEPPGVRGIRVLAGTCEGRDARNKISRIMKDQDGGQNINEL